MSVAYEDLIDDLRSGELDDTSRRRLSMVLKSQPSAVMELALLDAFDDEREPRPEDDEGIEALVAGTFAALDEEGRPSDVAPRAAAPPEPVTPLDPPKIAPEAAGRAAPLDLPPEPIASSGSLRHELGVPRLTSPMTTTQKLAVAVAKRPFLRPYLAAAVVLLSLSMGWTARGLFADDAPVTVENPPNKKIEVPAEADPRQLGSDDLLAFAENAVARDHSERGARLYEELLRRFPRSPEAPMARLGLARLQLEDLGDARAAAETYEGFLARHADDDLAPDAALGRARALEAAGSPDARAAWRQLEERYPDSGAAAVARRRGR